MLNSRFCLDRIVPEGMSQVSRWSEVENHKRRTLLRLALLSNGYFMHFLAQKLFLKLILQIKPHMHICSSSLTFRYPRKFGFRPILGWWRSILWRFSAIFNFGATEPDMPHFLLHLRTLFYEAHPSKIWQLWFPKKYKVFMETPLYHSTWTYIVFAVPFMVQMHSGLGGWVELIKRQEQQQHCYSPEDETWNGHRNTKQNPNRNHETIVLGLFSFEILKRDRKQ